jgi:hypothetical protein
MEGNWVDRARGENVQGVHGHGGVRARDQDMLLRDHPLMLLVRGV